MDKQRRPFCGWYILPDDSDDPILVDVMTGAMWFELFGDRRQLASDTVGEVRISTVFLGIDHRYHRDAPPVLWETMIFGGEHDGYCERYSSARAAQEGHNLAVRMVLNLP